MKDLVLLVADKNAQFALKGALGRPDSNSQLAFPTSIQKAIGGRRMFFSADNLSQGVFLPRFLQT